MEQLLRFLADGSLIIVLLGVAIHLILVIGRRLISVIPVVVMAGLTALLVGKIASIIYQPEIARPFEKLGVEPGAAFVDNPGFPSDHALLGAAALTALFFLSKSRTIFYILMAFFIAMCVARVAALVHTPVDVVAGALAGVSGALWYRKLTKYSA